MLFSSFCCKIFIAVCITRGIPFDKEILNVDSAEDAIEVNGEELIRRRVGQELIIQYFTVLIRFYLLTCMKLSQSGE